jgi:hypothetical protein
MVKKLYVQTVVIDKSVGIAAATKTFNKLMMNRHYKKGYRETEDSFRFKNIDKNKFDPTSYRSKKINDTVTLVFGHLKPEYDEEEKEEKE